MLSGSITKKLAQAFTALGCIGVVSVSIAQDYQVYADKEGRFSFQYPASWTVQPPASPNSKAKVASPLTPYFAECALIIKSIGQVSGYSQAELDRMLLQSPPNKAQYQSMLMQSFSDVSVTAVSQGRLGARIAHLVRARYSMTNQPDKAFVSIRMAKAFSPGMSWGLTCGGQGRTPAEAGKAFEYWQAAINHVFTTFRAE